MRIWFTGRACIPKESCNEDDLLSEDHLYFFDPVICLVRVRMKKWKPLGGFSS